MAASTTRLEQSRMVLSKLERAQSTKELEQSS
jgi:hypothetical protein